MKESEHIDEQKGSMSDKEFQQKLIDALKNERVRKAFCGALIAEIKNDSPLNDMLSRCSGNLV